MQRFVGQRAEEREQFQVSKAAEASTAMQPAAQVALKPIDSVRKTLEQLKPQMRLALPKHLTADRLVRIVMTAVQNTPKLLECDRTSFFAAVMSCAQLGLEPDGVLGQAYLVPFGSKVQLIVGYKGLISLARNSGDVVSIAAHEVCRNDHFKYVFGLEEKLEHIPAAGERGEITHFYAVAQFKGGGHHFDVMTRAEVEAIRDGSSGYKTAMRFKKAGEEPNTPWASSFVEMGKKSAIRRIAKYLPMNVQKAAAMTEAYESGRHADLGDAGELRVDAAQKDGNIIDVEAVSVGNGLDSFAGSESAEGAA
jgi:recombination protein RecT